jgi:hypothetical protein
VRGYYEGKGDVLARLRRIEGQVGGLQKMVENDVYCIDILTQISAASPRSGRSRSGFSAIRSVTVSSTRPKTVRT